MLAAHGAAAELNPLAVSLQAHGLFYALVAKLTVWALVAAIVAVLGPRPPAAGLGGPRLRHLRRGSSGR